MHNHNLMYSCHKRSLFLRLIDGSLSQKKNMVQKTRTNMSSFIRIFMEYGPKKEDLQKEMQLHQEKVI